MICSDWARSWWVSIPSRCRSLRRELIAFLEQLEERDQPKARATTSKDPFAGIDSTAGMLLESALQ